MTGCLEPLAHWHNPQADAGGFGKDDAHAGIHFLLLHQYGKHLGRAVLLHEDRCCPDIECTCRQQFFVEISVNLGIHIVNIGFKNGEFAVNGAVVLTPIHPQYIGNVQFMTACPIANAFRHKTFGQTFAISA